MSQRSSRIRTMSEGNIRTYPVPPDRSTGEQEEQDEQSDERERNNGQFFVDWTQFGERGIRRRRREAAREEQLRQDALRREEAAAACQLDEEENLRSSISSHEQLNRSSTSSHQSQNAQNVHNFPLPASYQPYIFLRLYLRLFRCQQDILDKMSQS